MRIANRILIRKTERKTPLGRPGNRSEDNLKLILKGYGCLVWIQTGCCEHGGDFFLILSQWLFAFCYVVSLMKFEVFWDVTPCQLVNI